MRYLGHSLPPPPPSAAASLSPLDPPCTPSPGSGSLTPNPVMCYRRPGFRAPIRSPCSPPRHRRPPIFSHLYPHPACVLRVPRHPQHRFYRVVSTGVLLPLPAMRCCRTDEIFPGAQGAGDTREVRVWEGGRGRTICCCGFDHIIV